MGLRKNALGVRRGHHRDRKFLDQRLERFEALRAPKGAAAAVAQKNQRLSRGGELRKGERHLLKIGAARQRPVQFWRVRQRNLVAFSAPVRRDNAARRNVIRQTDMCRARRYGARDTQGLLEQRREMGLAGDDRAVRHGIGEDRRDIQSGVDAFLQIPPAEILLRNLAGDRQHGGAAGLGIHDAGQSVGRGRPGRCQHHAEAVGYAGIAVRDIGRTRLMTANNETKALLLQLEFVHHIDERAAGNSKQGVDAFQMQIFQHQLGDVQIPFVGDARLSTGRVRGGCLLGHDVAEVGGAKAALSPSLQSA